jgi:hypothetical protein
VALPVFDVDVEAAVRPINLDGSVVASVVSTINLGGLSSAAVFSEYQTVVLEDVLHCVFGDVDAAAVSVDNLGGNPRVLVVAVDLAVLSVAGWD